MKTFGILLFNISGLLMQLSKTCRVSTRCSPETSQGGLSMPVLNGTDLESDFSFLTYLYKCRYFFLVTYTNPYCHWAFWNVIGDFLFAPKFPCAHERAHRHTVHNKVPLTLSWASWQFVMDCAFILQSARYTCWIKKWIASVVFKAFRNQHKSVMP